jgi:hypothetical protein
MPRVVLLSVYFRPAAYCNIPLDFLVSNRISLVSVVSDFTTNSGAESGLQSDSMCQARRLNYFGNKT